MLLFEVRRYRRGSRLARAMPPESGARKGELVQVRFRARPGAQQPALPDADGSTRVNGTMRCRHRLSKSDSIQSLRNAGIAAELTGQNHFLRSFATLPGRSPLPLRLMPVRSANRTDSSDGELGPMHLVI